MLSSPSVVVTVGPAGSAPKGLTIIVFFNLGGGRYRTHQMHPPGGLPSTSSSNSVVATAGPTDSAP
jgi:hypothetical protein